MELIGIKTPLIKYGDNLVDVILESDAGEKLKDNDILVIASSVVSTVLGRTRKIDEIEPSEKAKKLAEKSGLEEKFVEIILQESDEVIGPSDKCILTLKDGMLRINAGVDRTNVPRGYALLIPEDSDKVAKELRKEFENKTGKKIGIIISDSHVQPLRLGTIGQSIGSSGVKVALDCRNQRDLYGRKLQITFKGIGDQISAAAQLVMGEADESIPAVIVRGLDINILNGNGITPKVPPKKCVYSKFFEECT